MLKQSDSLMVRCEALGSKGEGICRHRGQVLFVPWLLPGEEAQVLVVKATKDYARADIVDRLSVSPERQRPPCPHYGDCGGCDTQHMTSDAALHFKRQRVMDALGRIGKMPEVPVQPVLGMACPFRYRNKTAFAIKQIKGRVRAGYFRPASHDLVAVDSCLIAHEAGEKAAHTVLHWMNDEGISAYDAATGQGLIRHVVTRTNSRDEAMVTVVATADSLPGEDELLSALQTALPGLKSLYLSHNPTRGSQILGDSQRLIWGQERLTEKLLGLTFTVSPASFFQVNHEQTEILYREAMRLLNPSPSDTVLDLYCGAGTLSLLAARQAKLVIGVEVVADAVADARQNALGNDINNVDFRLGSVEALLPEILSSCDSPPLALVDPPRKGLDKSTAETLAQSAIRRLVYVSCDPATQARDAAILASSGFVPVLAQPVDMFPQTAAVENLMLFERQ